MKTAEEILKKHIRNEIQDGDELSDRIIESIEGYKQALKAMEEYAGQFEIYSSNKKNTNCFHNLDMMGKCFKCGKQIEPLKHCPNKTIDNTKCEWRLVTCFLCDADN
jgi:hypothetical protein